MSAMLYEIFCDKFAEKIDGKLVTRPVIRFKEGLNTVIGDKNAGNSIGKSTFLLAIDFCFGGNDYVDPKVNNVKEFVHEHTIKFAYKFGEKIERYSRCTTTPNEVNICDESYNPIQVIDLEDFTKHLFDGYEISLQHSTFRDIVGRYMRIYGKENYAEKKPLKYGDEPEEGAIVALEKLFNVFGSIEQYRQAYQTRSERRKVRAKATDFGDIVSVAKNKTEVKKNNEEIQTLEEQLRALTEKEDIDMSTENQELIGRAAEIKGQLTILKRKRSRLLTQLNAVKANIAGDLVPTENDFQELMEFFPNVNVERIKSIEGFHKKMQTILSVEMNGEIDRLTHVIAEVTREMQVLENALRTMGAPVNVSQKYMEKCLDLRRRIDVLKEKNAAFATTQQVEADAKSAKAELAKERATQLEIVQTTLNQEMVRINEFIYSQEGKKKPAPSIAFEDTRTGKPKYSFQTQSDRGTGTNFKGLIVYDLSILSTTQAPVIAHDSLTFKNIGDLPIDGIMQAYAKSTKQIFIAFDKVNAYSTTVKKITEATKVLELHSDGGELFGWSWADGHPNEYI